MFGFTLLILTLLIYRRLLRELQSEGALTAEQSLRVKEWLCSVEEERSGLTTASGPDSGIENSSTEDSVAPRRGRPSVRSQVRLSANPTVHYLSAFRNIDLCNNVPDPQDPEAAEERWSHEQEMEKDGDSIAQCQAQIQKLERENTDFLSALEDAMEQYKQQVGHSVIVV